MIVRFNNIDEFLNELTVEHGHVADNIVRLTKCYRPGGAEPIRRICPQRAADVDAVGTDRLNLIRTVLSVRRLVRVFR
jgi:hypothetical protein